MPRRLALLTATILLVLAVPALAQPTFTPACASNDACRGLAQPARMPDSVVVAWRIHTTTEQTVALRSTQTLESGTATTATSAPVTVGVSALVQTVAERLPIAAGGELELMDASGPVFEPAVVGTPQFEAVLEPDVDGDGYGDTTQDACTANAADHTSPCNGTATIGSPLTLAPDPHGFSASGNAVQALQLSAAGTVSTVPKAGVLTHWRLRAQPGKGDTVLQLLRPTSGAATSYTVVAESELVHATSTDVITVDAQLAVKAGDRLAVGSALNGGNRDLGAIAARAADELVANDPPKTAGQTWTPDTSLPQASACSSRPTSSPTLTRTARATSAGQRRSRADLERARGGRQPGGVEPVLHRPQRRTRHGARRGPGAQRRGRGAWHGAGRDDLQGPRSRPFRHRRHLQARQAGLRRLGQRLALVHHAGDLPAAPAARSPRRRR